MALVSADDENVRDTANDVSQKPLNGKIPFSNGLMTTDFVEKVTVLTLNDLDIKQLPEEFPDLPNLYEINLKGNQLQDLSKQLLKARNLRILNLAKNNFNSVPDCLLIGLRTLTHINLAGNLLTEFHEPPACLPFLKELILSNNRIEEIPHWILSDHMYVLNLLDLSFNPCFKNVRAFKIPPKNRISGFIHSLNIKNTNFSIVSLNLLLYFPNLKILDMGNCGQNPRNASLRNIIDNIGKGYLPESLVEFRMQDVSSACLPDISYLNQLKILDLSKNELIFLPYEKHFLSQNLSYIDLSSTKLINLPDYIGKLTFLTHLMLASNNLIALPSEFNLLKNLEVLDLYDNMFETLPYLNNHCNLKGFDICYNCVEPPLKPLGENGPDYTTLKQSLREKFNFLNRCDSVKEMVESVTLSEDDCASSSDSFTGAEYSSEPMNSEPGEVFKRREEEEWDLNSEDDETFDPTSASAEIIEKDWETNNDDEILGQNCLKYCSEYIQQSPHLFQPYEERSNSDFLSQHRQAPKLTVVEGQFDDA